MPLVTLSASYGAGGSEIGPKLAQRLGVPYVDRAIPQGVADKLAVPLTEAHERDQSPRSTLSRILLACSPISQAYGAPAPENDPTDREYARATEEVLTELAKSGNGVILGRAGMLVLRDAPGCLRVRLDGPREARIAQAARVEQVSEDAAAKRMDKVDSARADYVRQFYDVDICDGSLYHVTLDSTAIPLDTCIDVIVTLAMQVAAGSDAPSAPAAAPA
jgi:cytidylate kinase